jgi:hypothetical protein
MHGYTLQASQIFHTQKIVMFRIVCNSDQIFVEVTRGTTNA